MATIEQLNDFRAAGVDSLVQISLRGVSADAGYQLSGQAAKVMLTFGKILEKEYRNRRGRMISINQQVGTGAQARVVASYSQRVNQENTPGYRASASGKFKRYAGGKMLQALKDPSFFRASHDGLAFINTQLLDTKAKQWYRLNFGAGPKGRSGQYHAGEFRMRFFEEAAGPAITLKQAGPAPAYWIPKGLFVNESGVPQKLGGGRGDIFVPIRSSSARSIKAKAKSPARKRNMWTGGYSRGFGGFHFFDEGLRYIAQTWPAAHVKLIDEWVKEATEFGTGPAAKIAVPKAELNRQSKYLSAELRRLNRNTRLRGPLRDF